MKPSPYILYLDSNLQAAAGIHSMLAASGIEASVECVDNPADFTATLERGGVDVVIASNSVAGFDGHAALALVRERWGATPCILIAADSGEDAVVEAMKKGAADYIVQERPWRLVTAVEKALQQSAVSPRSDESIQTQKLEVLGRLVGGVAHDFNNMLGIIMGYSDIILLQLRPTELIHKQTREIRHAAERAAALTRQLLVFCSKQEVQLVVLDLHQVIEGMDKMLRQLIDENVELSVISGPDLGRVKADSGYIGQVLMNLVINARDAMPNGGRLTIETRNVQLDGTAASTGTPAAPGHYVMLSVTDTGVGMTDEIKAHLFEAFFTTKPKGKGTGLGLMTCQTLVSRCGGHIDLRSAPGQGTTFKVYFPRVDQPLESEVHPHAGESNDLPRGTETLLLVEDEPTVRHLARDVLLAQGYEVLTACNGQDGLRMAREHQGPPIPLVVTDVIMPQMGGKVMAEWLKSTYPDIKVLFTSGYTDEAISRQGVLDPGVAFLPKPYTPATLTRKVREMLDDTR